MSRSTYGAGNVQQAREYIAELRHTYPELQNINPQSDAQVIRYANKAHSYEQAGLTPTPQALRGHEVTPERPGGAVKPLPPEYEKFRQDRATPANVTKFGTGSMVISGHNKSDVRPALKAAGDRRITSVGIKGKDGEWISVDTNIKASDLLNMLNGGMSWRDFLNTQQGKRYKGRKLSRDTEGSLFFAA